MKYVDKKGNEKKTSGSDIYDIVYIWAEILPLNMFK